MTSYACGGPGERLMFPEVAGLLLIRAREIGERVADSVKEAAGTFAMDVPEGELAVDGIMTAVRNENEQ